MKKKEKKKILMIVAVAAVALIAIVAIFAGGNNGGPLDVDDAKKVVLNDLGANESNVSSLHVHTTTVDTTPCYLIYVTYNGENWEYVVNGLTGEIIEKAETDSGHSH